MPRLSLILGLSALLCTAPVSFAADSPTLILHHGKIATVDKNFRIAEAIAIREEKIVAVGTNDDVLKLKGEKTELVDLQGKFVLPGLIDSHVHPSSAAMHEFSHPVPDMETIADVLAYIKSRAEAQQPGTWINVSQIFI